MKYVMFEIRHDSIVINVPIMFPDSLVHSLVADEMQRVFKKHRWPNARVVSAGSVTGIDDVYTSGESETLGVASRGKRDQRIIENYDFLHGIE